MTTETKGRINLTAMPVHKWKKAAEDKGLTLSAFIRLSVEYSIRNKVKF